jgi:hypothetical protein
MSILATDAFSGAGALGGTWVDDGPGTAWSQSAGVVKSGGSDDRYARNTTPTWPNDQWSESTIGTAGIAGVGLGNGANVRKASGSTDQYRFTASGAGWELMLVSGASSTSLASGSGTTWAAGDRVYLEAQGASIVGKKNTTNGAGGTTIATQSESTLAAGGAGIAYSSVDVNATIDSWQGGDFSASGPTAAQMAGIFSGSLSGGVIGRVDA